jgi:chromosome segregation ATPase
MLKEKDDMIESTEASLAKACSLNEKKDTQIAEQNKQIEQLSNDFEKTKLNFKDNLNRLSLEAEYLKFKIKAKGENNVKLSEAIKCLRDTCSSFVARCSSRLREIFHSVGAAYEEAKYASNDFPKHWNG